MILIDDSQFSERDRLLVKTVIAYAREEVPFSHVRHILEWGAPHPNARNEEWAKQHVS